MQSRQFRGDANVTRNFPSRLNSIITQPVSILAFNLHTFNLEIRNFYTAPPRISPSSAPSSSLLGNNVIDRSTDPLYRGSHLTDAWIEGGRKGGTKSVQKRERSHREVRKKERDGPRPKEHPSYGERRRDLSLSHPRGDMGESFISVRQ